MILSQTSTIDEDILRMYRDCIHRILIDGASVKPGITSDYSV